MWEVSEASYALFGGREAADGCTKWSAGVCEGEGGARERSVWHRQVWRTMRAKLAATLANTSGMALRRCLLRSPRALSKQGIFRPLQRPALESSAAQRTSRPEGWWREPPVGRPPSPAPPARPRDTGARTLPMPPSPAGVRCPAPSAPVVQHSYAALRPTCGLRRHRRRIPARGSPCTDQYWNSR